MFSSCREHLGLLSFEQFLVQCGADIQLVQRLAAVVNVHIVAIIMFGLMVTQQKYIRIPTTFTLVSLLLAGTKFNDFYIVLTDLKFLQILCAT